MPYTSLKICRWEEGARGPVGSVCVENAFCVLVNHNCIVYVFSLRREKETKV